MLKRLYRFLVTEQFAALDRLRDEPDPGRRSPGFKVGVTFVTVAVMLTLMSYYVLDGEFQSRVATWLFGLVEALPDGGLRDALVRVQPLYRHVAWSLGCLFCYLVVPALVVVGVFREPLSRYGLSTRGFFRHLPIYLLLFLPVFGSVVVVSYSQQFQRTYPFYHDPQGLWDLAIWEAFYCLQFFALEFFFRGFMVHAVKHRMGAAAVFAMVVPYCMIHFQKPMAECLAAILAGTVLGVLSLRTSTLWGGVFIHSAVAISMDWASLLQRDRMFGG